MFTDDIIQICSNLRTDDFFVSPGIPNDKLFALTCSTMMPPNTRVFALIDTTVFGSAKNGMLIAENGLYFHNDNNANIPGSFFMSWNDLWQTNNTMFPFRKELGELVLNNMLQFEFSGCSMNADQLVLLLVSLRSAYGKYVDAQNTPSSSSAAPKAQPVQVKCPFCDTVFDGSLHQCPSCGASAPEQKTPIPAAVPPPVIPPTVPTMQQTLAYQQNMLKVSSKSRTVYILLALFLGGLGIHNFYVGRFVEGILQLLLTVLTMGIGYIGAELWAFINIFTVTTDAKGNTLA